MFAKRINALQPSTTFALDAKAKQLGQQGRSVINLGLGEPDFPTPKNIKSAGVSAIQEGFTHYTETAGLLELREAIAHKLRTDNGIAYLPSEILVGAGSKQLLFNAIQVLGEKGNEVVIPVPTWETYIEQVKLAECSPIFVKLEYPFKLKAKEVFKKITSKTKILILNSPSNPTGMIVESSELEKLAKLAINNTIFIISDEIYEKIIYEGHHVSIASLGKKIKELTITISGFSKAYAMTGWRIGYAAAPQRIIEKMRALQSQTTSCASSISQMAAKTALQGPQISVKRMVGRFLNRRNDVTKNLSKIERIAFTKPDGSFYLFVDIRKLLGTKHQSSADWCSSLLEEKGVLVIPGEAFYYPGFFRLSLTASREDLREAIERIKEFTG